MFFLFMFFFQGIDCHNTCGSTKYVVHQSYLAQPKSKKNPAFTTQLNQAHCYADLSFVIHSFIPHKYFIFFLNRSLFGLEDYWKQHSFDEIKLSYEPKVIKK